MVKNFNSQTLFNIIIILLIILWIYAAGSKLAEFSDFRRSLNNQPFSKTIVKILFYAIPFSEILTSLLLVFPKTKILGLIASLSLLAAFSAYIGFILAGFWSYVPCSCGGLLESMGWKTHLLFNLFFLSINLYAIYLKRKEANGSA